VASMSRTGHIREPEPSEAALHPATELNMSLSRLLTSFVDWFRRLLGGGGYPPKEPTKPELLVCPNPEEQRTDVEIGKEGGVVAVGGHRLELPPGSVREPVKFSVALLADKVLKLDIKANGEDSFKFENPATLTLTFEKCEAPSNPSYLFIAKIDPKTNEVLARLDSRVNERERTVTAQLSSLTAYSLARPT
jgi:hypothetical protein